jgi:asparagine synthase (glutamine-hydrolysing)
MCGIAGIYVSDGKVEPEWIVDMTNSLKHRGPDDEGYLGVNTQISKVFPLTGAESRVRGERVDTFKQSVDLFLGHRRLSILDLSPLGHQPMCNHDKSIWILHNGEIYNYIELREELKRLGYIFKTNTDTEVLLAAYEAWGENCLERLNGMWSFVIYDGRKNILFGSRDRFGVKPFYYYLDSKSFAFASEIKSLLKIPFVKREVNTGVLFDYFVFKWLEREEETFFKNIFELPPSFAFQHNLSNNEFKKWKYYELEFFEGWENFKEEKLKEYVEEIKNLIFNAVRLRLRSDVPIGSCLSGGLDSSSIVCVINKLLERSYLTQIGERQKLFTASYNIEAVDESKWAEMVVKSTRTSWYRTFPSARELLQDLEELVYVQDIPFLSTSIYAQYRVMKLAKENGVKVLLDGQGGDELFTGYVSYYVAFFIEMLRRMKYADFWREFNSLGNSPVSKKFILFSLGKYLLSNSAPFFIKSFFKRMDKVKKYLNPDFWGENKERIEKLRGRRYTSLNSMLYDFISRSNLKSLLRFEDRNSMRFSIESRTPFADDKNLIEYVFRIPPVYKIHNGWSKFLLREATKDIVPDPIRHRRDKIGFATPERFWLKEIKEELLSYITSDLDSFLNVNKLKEDWDRLFEIELREDFTDVWRFIDFAVWKKVFNL